MFYYQAADGAATIFGGRDLDGIVEIPEMIGGRPVTGLAPYAFSDGYGRQEMLKGAGPLALADWEGNPAAGTASASLEGRNGLERGGVFGSGSLEENGSGSGVLSGLLAELTLPPGIRKIGNYAFYNCYDLETFRCYSSIEDVGSGLFTGCTGLRRLDIRMVEGKRSCFKELVTELRQELFVNCYFGKKRAWLIFPEMYEASVENTPARLISQKMHGCGHLYRYCFQESVFQFPKYDSLFPHALAENQERTAVCLAMGRLKYPMGLQDRYRLVYEGYVKEHMALAAEIALDPERNGKKKRETQDENAGLLAWLGETYCDSKELFDELIGAAGRAGADELAFLLDLEHKRFPSGRRKFSI